MPSPRHGITDTSSARHSLKSRNTFYNISYPCKSRRDNTNEHHRNIHSSSSHRDAPALSGCVHGNRTSIRNHRHNPSTHTKQMTTPIAVSYFILSFASCFACYRLGQENILHRFREYCDKRKAKENNNNSDNHDDFDVCSKFDQFTRQ